MQMNIHEAKTNLSVLIRAVEAGEKVTICRAGKPVAHLTPARKPGKKTAEEPKRRLGLLRGQMTMSADFDEPLPDEFWLGTPDDPLYQ